jgi:hypothetical protein
MIFERLRNLGFDLEKEELFTALKVSREFLVKNKANAYRGCSKNPNPLTHKSFKAKI